MIARLRSWWQKTSKTLDAVIISSLVILLVLLVLIILGYIFNWPWTGLHSKTLYDWLQLLFVPGVLTLGAIWFTSRQNHDREISEKQQKADRGLAIDNQQEAALQAYIDNMSELILEKKLRESQPGDEVRTIAHVRTLAVLRRLNAERKRIVLQFLHDSDLIDKDKTIIGLRGANLRGADLHGVYQPKANLHEAQLNGANLHEAKLREAELSIADLTGADLSKVHLSGAHLSGADLSGADLSGARIHKADLSGADLSGADLTFADLRETILKEAKYNTKPIPKKNEKGQPVIDQQGKPVMIEPTQWPQGFELKKAVGLICVD